LIESFLSRTRISKDIYKSQPTALEKHFFQSSNIVNETAQKSFIILEKVLINPFLE